MRRHRWEDSLDRLDALDCIRQPHIVVEAESLKGTGASAPALYVECKSVVPESNKRLNELWLVQVIRPDPFTIPTPPR